jgi:hypothetical protein
MTTMPDRIAGGVGTHLDVHVAAALDHIGGLLGLESFAVTGAGYRHSGTRARCLTRTTPVSRSSHASASLWNSGSIALWFLSMTEQTEMSRTRSPTTDPDRADVHLAVVVRPLPPGPHFQVTPVSDFKAGRPHEAL